MKVANLVLRDQPPPRKDTPFWIMGPSYEQVCATCWAEKLLGHGMIPTSEIDSDRIRWLDSNMGWPLAVPLKPWGEDYTKNWVLEFKSYEQGRKQFQARSIGGFMLSEQFSWSLLIETLRGCRDYMFPGAQFAEFTPVSPDLCMELEKVMDDPPPGWSFYRANTELNTALADGWFETFFGSVSEEQRETRLTGALAVFEGVIYPSFSVGFHTVDPKLIEYPDGVQYFRGTDWGASEEHPFFTVLGYRDGVGAWTIFDEYYSINQSMLAEDHAAEIKKKWKWLDDDPNYGMMYADPSRPDLINAFNQYGIPTSQAANSVYEGIECIRALLKPMQVDKAVVPKLRVSKKCKHLIEQLRKYRWSRKKKVTETTGIASQVAKPVPLKREDDGPDALRYMIFSEHQYRGAAPDSLRHAEYERRHGMPEGRRSAILLREQLRRPGR